ncbi:cell division protein FtsN [Thalassotalea sp. M1531]|uniref:Cell division protein FtsN n=1 Tax=Thalassotalea algicola TaxID=2716224 RepID=A0A7Y0LFJ2_9GAMM|nr:SPOR domain-containing protein [Thalassotalea algicola]NMP33536.1 cell division protein FtsN [Thalassotalea algicola]
MAPQDYVSRSSNKKKSPYKKQAQQPEGMSIKLKIIILLTIVAIAGAGYFLWFLKGVEPVEQTVTPTKQSTHSSSDLPTPPDEKWDYIDKLKNGEEIEGGHYEVVEKGPYRMPCGSFRDRKKAESMKAQIAFTGLVANISESVGSNGTWYRVILGPYPRKRMAEKDKHKLKRNNITTCQILLMN